MDHPIIDITVGKTTVKMGEGFDNSNFGSLSNLLVQRDGGEPIPARKVVITLEFEKSPQIDICYIEPANSRTIGRNHVALSEEVRTAFAEQEALEAEEIAKMCGGE